MKDKLIEKYITTALINNLGVDNLNDLYIKVTDDDEYVINENGQETLAVIHAYDTGELTPEVIEEMEKQFFYYQDNLQDNLKEISSEDFFFESEEVFDESTVPQSGWYNEKVALAKAEFEYEKLVEDERLRKQTPLENLIISQILDSIYCYTTKLLNYTNFEEVVTNVIKIWKSDSPKFPDYPIVPFVKFEKILRESLIDVPDDELSNLNQEQLNFLIMAMTSSKIDDVLSKMYDYDNYVLVQICLDSFEEYRD